MSLLRLDLDLGEVLLTFGAPSEALIRFEMSRHVASYIQSRGGHLYLTRDERDESIRNDQNRLTASLDRPSRDISFMTIPFEGIQVHVQRTGDLYMYETVHVWLKKRLVFFRSLSARVMIRKRFSTPN